jgi:hypothetical protein
MMQIPKIVWHEPIAGSYEEGFFTDAETHDEIHSANVEATYNRMIETLTMLHKHWSQIVEIAWEANGDKEKFTRLVRYSRM